jgi:OAR motif
MHKKSLEAAEHFKNDMTSASRDGCDTQMTSSDDLDGSPINLAAKYPNLHAQQSPSQNHDRDEIRSNSIATLRAKAQDYQARLMEDSTTVKTLPDPRKNHQVLRDPNKPDTEI